MNKLSHNFEKASLIVADTLLLPLSLWFAIALRYGTLQPNVSNYIWLFPLIPVLAVPIFIRIGLYRAVIRFIDEKVIWTVFLGVSISVLMLTFIVALLRIDNLPRTSIVIYWILAMSYMGTSRFFLRGLLRRWEHRKTDQDRVVIYGASHSGAQLALALRESHYFYPVLFLDDKVEMHGKVLGGLKVYPLATAEYLLKKYDISQVLLAMPSASRSQCRDMINYFEQFHVQLKIVPLLTDLVSGSVRVQDIREVDVEDLLGRDIVPPQPHLLEACIKGKRVLVTGAGGSIGAELCRQIISSSPESLILYEVSEYALYNLHRELQSSVVIKANPIQIVPILGTILDETDLQRVLTHYRIDTVYHAAAYKHVPLVEHNVIAGIVNNSLGTWAAVRAAMAAEVKTFVLISTDKAVRPTNIMGASKRLAELILQAYAQQNNGTQFCMVRFGNVLGSSGSVVPLFREQIKKGGPVTVTHAEITRYFMTIPEAAQLVSQASAMAKGGDVFVLDMGEPVKIADLARKMIHLSGFEVKDEQHPLGDIEIHYTGLRPGEKLYEELLIGDQVTGTEHPRIWRAQEAWLSWLELEVILQNLQLACSQGDDVLALQWLHKGVQEFKKADSESSINLSTPSLVISNTETVLH